MKRELFIESLRVEEGHFQNSGRHYRRITDTLRECFGKDAVNPCSLVLSAVMMLEYMGWKEPAALITRALEDSFSQGRATRDLARFMDGGVALPTSVFAQEIVKRIVD